MFKRTIESLKLTRLGLAMDTLGPNKKIVAVLIDKDEQRVEVMVEDVNRERKEITGKPMESISTPTLGSFIYATIYSDSAAHSERYHLHGYSTIDIGEMKTELKQRIRGYALKLHHDTEIIVFRSGDGEEFKIGRDFNMVNTGFCAKRTKSSEKTAIDNVFFEWAMLDIYEGTWFPYGDDMTPVKDFVYHPYMHRDLRNKSLIPERVNEDILGEAETLLGMVRDLEERVKDLKDYIAKNNL